MTERLAVTLTTTELEDIVAAGVRKGLVEYGARGRAQPDSDAEMTTADVVALFRLAPKSGPKTIWRWRRERGFPAPRNRGGRVRFVKAQVDAWRAAQTSSGPGSVNGR